MKWYVLSGLFTVGTSLITPQVSSALTTRNFSCVVKEQSAQAEAETKSIVIVDGQEYAVLLTRGNYPDAEIEIEQVLPMSRSEFVVSSPAVGTQSLEQKNPSLYLGKNYELRLDRVAQNQSETATLSTKAPATKKSWNCIRSN